MKTLKERTEIQVASLAGHVIQYKHFNDAEWMNCDNLPLFNWWKKDYRIKK